MLIVAADRQTQIGVLCSLQVCIAKVRHFLLLSGVSLRALQMFGFMGGVIE